MSADAAGKLPFSAAILAGGESRRMGRDKSLLPIDAVPMIRRVGDVLEKMFPEVLVIAEAGAPYERMGFSVVADIHPGNNALGGLYTAVAAAGASHVFVTGCDMPLLRPALISGIASMVEGRWDVVVPVRDARPEPLCAFYGKKCEAPIARSISRGALKMVGFHPEVRVRRVEEAAWRLWDPDAASFLNANTPAEFRNMQSRRAGGGAV